MENDGAICKAVIKTLQNIPLKKWYECTRRKIIAFLWFKVGCNGSCTEWFIAGHHLWLKYQDNEHRRTRLAALQRGRGWKSHAAARVVIFCLELLEVATPHEKDCRSGPAETAILHFKYTRPARGAYDDCRETFLAVVFSVQEKTRCALLKKQKTKNGAIASDYAWDDGRDRQGEGRTANGLQGFGRRLSDLTDQLLACLLHSLGLATHMR